MRSRSRFGDGLDFMLPPPVNTSPVCTTVAFPDGWSRSFWNEMTSTHCPFEKSAAEASRSSSGLPGWEVQPRPR